MKFKLKESPYRWYDFFTIPASCDLLSTLMLGLQKLLTALSAVFQVIVLARFLDSAGEMIINKSDGRDVLLWFVLLVVCVGWRRISFVVGSIFIRRLYVHATAQLGMAFVQKRSRIPFYLIEQEESWNLIKRVCDRPENQVRLMLQRSCNLILYIIRIFGVLWIVFTQVWWIGVMTAVLCIPLIFLSLKSGEKNYTSNKEAVEYKRRYQYLGELLTGRAAANERTLFGFSEKVNGEWHRQYETARKINLKANILMTLSVRGSSAVITILSSFITVALIFPTAQGEISVGMFIALATGMYDLVNMVGVELTKAVSQLAQCKEYLKDLTAFAALPELEGVDQLPIKESIPFRELEFRDVSFSYPGTEKMILHHMSFTLHAGNHYAFVGINGAGKTTIVKLLTGLYNQYTGEILLNGRELRTWRQEELKVMFCGIYQDFAKYYISVKDNVALGMVNEIENEDSLEQVERALRAVGIYEEMSDLPQGLNTSLGRIQKEGVDISGGQWQKLAMARAVRSYAPILILDEPTAALDPISESRMYEEFEALSRNRTTLFISHRLGSTKLADTIFVLKDGSIVEYGSHNELMERGENYAEMFESQRRWYQ